MVSIGLHALCFISNVYKQQFLRLISLVFGKIKQQYILVLLEILLVTYYIHNQLGVKLSNNYGILKMRD